MSQLLLLVLVTLYAAIFSLSSFSAARTSRARARVRRPERPFLSNPLPLLPGFPDDLEQRRGSQEV